jgi:hypothetical protein
MQLTVGREAVLNFTLAVGQVAESVEVSGEAPLVQTTESTISYLVDDRTIRDLPLNGRDISQLILLNPGVIQNSNGRWGNADNGFARRFSISGMRGEDNSYLLDGSYINDYYRHVPAGPSGALTGIETVQEFQTLTASFSASYGRALGGVFNAVTKSGTNEWHGSAYDFLRNSALDARNFFDRQPSPSAPRLPPFRRNQFGGTVGGPVMRDKTFFFVAYEGLRESLTESGIANVPDLNARRGILPCPASGFTGLRAPCNIPGTLTYDVPVNQNTVPFLRMYPEPTPGGRNFGDGTAQLIFQVTQPTGEDFGQARVDQQLSSNDSLFVRFTGNNADRARVRGLPDRFETGELETRLMTLAETHVFSPALLNNFRFAFNRVIPRVDQIVPPAEPDQISVAGQDLPAGVQPGSGIASATGSESPGGFYTTNRFAVHDDVNLTLNNHSLQFGGMVERMRYNPNNPIRPFGEWLFGSLENFLLGIPDTMRGTPLQFGNFRRGMRQWFLALYLQDDWRVTPSLTLNLGLRWEPYTVPTEVNGLIENQRRLTDTAPTIGDPYWKNKSWRDFSPRFGFAWSPLQAGKTSVRGGFGLLYVPNDSSVYTVPMVRALSFSPVINITNPTGFPDALAAIAASRSTPGGQDVVALDYENLKSPRAVQYSLNVQQQIGESTVITLGYNGRRGVNLSSFGNYNTPKFQFNGVSLELPPGPAVVPNPGYKRIQYVNNNTNSWYNGFTAALQRRFSDGLQAQISYTYSKSLSEADGADTGNHVSSGGSGSLKYPYELSAGKGLSGYHLTNTFTASYSYELPFGRGMSGWTGHLAAGWQMTGIVTLQDGQPFTLRATSPTAIQDFIGLATPNVVPGYTHDQIIKGVPEGWFTLDAYRQPGLREMGNLARNPLIGPGRAQWDFGLTKNTTLTERLHLQFRGEAFNLLNRVNYAAPGQIANSAANNTVFTRAGAPIPSATVITQTATTSRQIQFGLKLTF